MQRWFNNLLEGLFGRRNGTAAAPSAPNTDPVPDPNEPEEPQDRLASIGKRRGHVDLFDLRDVNLDEAEQDVIDGIGRRIRVGDLTLPKLPSTHLAIMELLAQQGTDLKEVAELVAEDLALSSELVRAANSVRDGGAVETTSISQAVMRLGTRKLHGLMLGISMRGVIFRAPTLKSTAEEVWRQAQGAAMIARAIAPHFDEDPERAYLVGLLHDIGKVALLDSARKEERIGARMDGRLIAAIFQVHHQDAGEVMARGWGLSDEIVSVAGCHHDFDANEKHARSAALALLSHLLDLYLACGRVQEFRALAHHPAMGFLDPEGHVHETVLGGAMDVFLEAREKDAVAV